jgi:hypothetical protein
MAPKLLDALSDRRLGGLVATWSEPLVVQGLSG